MSDANDMELVRNYARQNSESAFAELVRRHINLVYSVAMRFTGNPGDAEEVTQAVFILLARKAAAISDRTVLTGWLYQTTRLTASSFLRSQTRRRMWEQESVMQSNLNAPETGNLWRQLAPHLEAAMSRLAERDRTLLALRFYENKTGSEAAALLGIREETAHKRTARALEKLRSFFSKRGVDSTTAIIANEISANSIQAAPLALAKSVTAVAAAKGVAASASTLTLIQGALKIMAWTKAQTTVIGIVIAGLAAYSVIQHQTESKLREQNESLRQQISQLSQPKVKDQNLSNQSALANSSEAGTRNGPNNPVPQPPPGQTTNQAQAATVPSNALVSQTASTTSVELPKASWTNAGFATPQAVLQSRGAAVLNGDRDLFKQSVFITDDARKFAEDTFVKMAEASNDPNKAQYIQGIVNNNLGVEEAILMPMMAANQNNSFTGYKIISQQVISDNELILQVETATVSASPQTETLNFQRFGGNWKIVYDQAAIQRMMQQ